MLPRQRAQLCIDIHSHAGPSNANASKATKEPNRELGRRRQPGEGKNMPLYFYYLYKFAYSYFPKFLPFSPKFSCFHRLLLQKSFSLLYLTVVISHNVLAWKQPKNVAFQVARDFSRPFFQQNHIVSELGRRTDNSVPTERDCKLISLEAELQEYRSRELKSNQYIDELTREIRALRNQVRPTRHPHPSLHGTGDRSLDSTLLH